MHTYKCIGIDKFGKRVKLGSVCRGLAIRSPRTGNYLIVYESQIEEDTRDAWKAVSCMGKQWTCNSCTRDMHMTVPISDEDIHKLYNVAKIVVGSI